MSRGFPSMTALLGLLAVAGFQNRDKIAEMLRGAGSSNPGTPNQDDQQDGLGGLLGNVGGGVGTSGQAGLGGLLGGLGSGGLGGLLGGGLGELMESFRQQGQGDVAESWVGMDRTSPSLPISSNRPSVLRCSRP